MASGTESATETSFWLKFFTEAHIPAGDAAHYAVLFSDNRIQRGMLLDLTKEYLTDMGVSRLGDVIAILKHAKTVHDQEAKDKALKGTKYTGSRSSPARRSTAASRMVDHFLSKTPDSGPMNKPPTPKLSMNTGGTKKSSVFDRLGSDSSGSGASASASTKITSSGESSVFSRLGGKSGQKRAANSTSPGDSEDEDDGPQSPLGYHGILKYPSSAKKSPTIPHKKIKVVLEDEPVQVTGVDKFKVTGLDKVKVTGLDRIKMGTKADGFNSNDVQSFKVQVSSTTATPKATKIKKRVTTMPASSSVDDLLMSARRLSVQKQEVTTTTPLTRTEGVLSMDAPTQPASVKTRLGVLKAAASSTTSGFGPSTQKLSAGDVKSRLGARTTQAAAGTKLTTTAASSQVKSRLGVKKTTPSGASSKRIISTPAQPKNKPASGVFSRLGKKTSVS